MEKVFNWLREEVEANSVDCGGADIISLHRVRVLINQAEREWEKKNSKAPARCLTCARYTDNDKVDNICYLCCKGIEDSYVEKRCD